MAENSNTESGENVKVPCCGENCLNELSQDLKIKFYRDFKLCKSFEAQSAFIIATVNENPVLNGRKKTYTRSYHIAQQQVCFKSFTAILGISQKKIKLAMDKRQSGSLDDKRGGAYHILSDESSTAIIKHINSFPHYLSHYRRETSQSLYLDPDLNTATMYRLFKETWAVDYPQTKPPCQNSYIKIFKSMGLKFKNLKSDTCKNCDKLANQIKSAKPSEKEDLEATRIVHWDRAAAIRQQMEVDFATGRVNPKVITILSFHEDPRLRFTLRIILAFLFLKNHSYFQCVFQVQGICYDLQKTFNLPKATSNVFYYTRNLNMFNLGVHDARTDRGFFHTWLENQAGRGAQEIASCLIKFLDANLQPEAEELIMWSDSCGGQNRNRLMCLMMQHWLAKQENLQRVCLRFLLSGHSYNV